jgi:hypothetical protein
MKQVYNEEDVVRYVYEEMDEEEYPVFFEALCRDTDLWNAYEELQIVKLGLGTTLAEPSSKSCQTVLQYASNIASEMENKPSNSIPNSTSDKTPVRWLHISIVLAVMLMSAWVVDQLEIFSPLPQVASAISSDDHAWMYDRLYRMEDDRVLPQMTGTNAYRLVRYSGDSYTDADAPIFE